MAKSVRTLLIAVTIFCVSLGWQMSIVQERETIQRLVEQYRGYVLAHRESDVIEDVSSGTASPPIELHDGRADIDFRR